MPHPLNPPRADGGGLAELLAVTRALAAPFDLHTLLLRITQAAGQLVRVDRVSVWLLDAPRQELFIEVAGDLPALRVPVGRGLVGACASQKSTLLVPDCHADPRFNPEIDRRSGYRTRNMLSVPLVDHQDSLVGVLQLLNKEGGDDLHMTLAMESCSRIWSRSQEECVSATRKQSHMEKEVMQEVISIQQLQATHYTYSIAWHSLPPREKFRSLVQQRSASFL